MNPLKLFKIRPEERHQAIVALVVILTFNVLFIYRMHDLFMQEGFGPYWKVFEHEFHLAGYDPLTYLGVTDWDFVYNVVRHPLLTFMIWPLWLMNQGLSALFGVNCVQYVVALPVMACSFYAYLFIYRINREVIRLRQYDATLLSAFYFSFAYIMLSVLVPDHFTISMFLLMLTLYLSGRYLRDGREFAWWESALFFIVTAGVTLSNGVKVFLSGLFVNGKGFFRLKYLFLAVILPAGLLWGIAMWQNQAIMQPREQAKKEAKLAKERQEKARVAQMSQEQRKHYRIRKLKREEVLKRQAAKTGNPVKNEGFWKWTDVTTSRFHTIYENLFGETIQFHRQHFLEDTLVFRPVFVKYDWIWSYVVEGIVLLLSAIGLWLGRRSRFLWLAVSFFAFDMLIHLVLGFGINEIFIMAPHWLFVLPIAIGYALRATKGNWHNTLQLTVLALTCYLWVYNAYLLIDFLLIPINATL